MNQTVSIPQPCHVGPEQLTPTAAGWHCASCQTSVVDFSRLSEAEILAHLAQAGSRRVCAAVPAPRLVPPAGRPRWSGSWLAIVLAFLGLRTASAVGETAPAPPVVSAPLAWSAAEVGQPRVIIRGQVLDDSLHVPISGAYVFVGDTRYGAVTDAEGRFELPIPADRPDVRNGRVQLRISAGHFTFVPQTIDVSIKPKATPLPLTVRLKSVPGRGYIMGKAAFIDAPKPF